jgi:hypothetical protein
VFTGARHSALSCNNEAIILMLFGEEQPYTLWCSSLCNCFQPPLTSSCLGPQHPALTHRNERVSLRARSIYTSIQNNRYNCSFVDFKPFIFR